MTATAATPRPYDTHRPVVPRVLVDHAPQERDTSFAELAGRPPSQLASAGRGRHVARPE